MRVKTGRPRQYVFAPVAGMQNAEVAKYISALGELRLRVYDQIDDLDTAILNATPGNAGLSIGRLSLHLASAEANWMRRAAEVDIGGSLAEELSAGKLENFLTPPPKVESAQILIKLMERVWNEITLPVASSMQDLSRPVRHESIKTAEQAFMHLIWHWTYHSGHIGLLALQSGRDYVWTFA